MRCVCGVAALPRVCFGSCARNGPTTHARAAQRTHKQPTTPPPLTRAATTTQHTQTHNPTPNPNNKVYADGRVCISILHTAGDDPHGYEAASERWSPVHTVETIMVSIISMLSSPNDESPANVDAAKEWREDRDGFKKRVGRCVRRSQEDM